MDAVQSYIPPEPKKAGAGRTDFIDILKLFKEINFVHVRKKKRNRREREDGGGGGGKIIR